MDRARVGQRWAQLDLGAVAEDLFPAYYLEVLIADDDGQRWTALTDGFITTTVETAKLGIYAGKDMTGKLAFIATPQLRHVYYNAYRGTDILAMEISTKTPMFILDLEEGVNDFGFLVLEDQNDEKLYIDFQRYIIIYNE